MNVTILAFARFKDIFGEKNEIEISNTVLLADILRNFATGYPDGVGALFSEEGVLHSYIFVMLNRVRIQPDEVSSQVVTDGDEIVIYPPVSGG